MLFSALFLTGCSKKVSDFTEEQHKQRISKKLEKRVDEWTYNNGEPINYYHGPYYETGNIDSKKYMLSTADSTEYICAVKTDNGFVNLVSGKTFNAESTNEISLQSTIRIVFYAGHGFDL